MKYKYAVVIGRFQPIHRGHINLIDQALKLAEKVIVVIGSSRGARTVKNPWTYAERSRFIQMPFEAGRVSTVGVGDYLYNDSLWVAELQETVTRHMYSLDGPGSTILVGHDKDRTTYYLSLFPGWGYFDVMREHDSLCATDIREAYFELFPPTAEVGAGMARYLYSVTDGEVAGELLFFTETDTYKDLRREYQQYAADRATYGDGPFVTADSVVLSNGHVLLIRRKNAPGKNLLALPGGFVEPHEFIQTAALRELREETGLELGPNDIQEVKVFDHPDRSLRGRVITHAHLITVPNTKLPIEAGSDAVAVEWVPIHAVFNRESEFFDDHYSILRYFLLRH